jgi:hypothetical protein
MNIRIPRGLRGGLIGLALALCGLPAAAQSYTYSVLIDSDSSAATGCSVAVPGGSVAGIDARLDASVSLDPPTVQSASLSRCSGGSFAAPQALPSGQAIGADRGPGPSDVLELALERSLLGLGTSNDWQLTFLSSSPLLGAVDVAGPVSAAGLGIPPLPAATVVPSTAAWSLILLSLLLAAGAAWALRRHPGLMLAVLMVGAASSAGVAWAVGYLADGEIGDWDVAALLVDPEGDTTEPEPQVDLRGIYAAREGSRAFFRFDLVETRLPVLVPPFLTTQFTVDENSANGTVVGSINTAPGGLANLLRFTLTGQSPVSAFSVNNVGGQIVVTDAAQLDFEARTRITLDVNVSLQGAPGFSFPRQIVIDLNDRNEAPQIAAQSLGVPENAANGEIVGSVVATDPDAGANGQLSYSIIGGSGQTIFAIAAGSGQVTVANAAALSLAASPYSLQVQVSDGGAPALTASATVTVEITDVNDAPSFTPGASPLVVNEDSAPYLAAWATAISDGDDGSQTLNFEIVSNSNTALFAAGPTLSPTGMLGFTLAPDANGEATLSVRLRDNGGTAGGGIDVSPTVNLVIQAQAVNDAPSFSLAGNPPTVLENAGAQTIAAFASQISAGPVDEAGQTLSFALTAGATTGSLAFSTAPAISADGTLTYTAQNGTIGTATFSVVLSDNGGTANGGVDSSAAQSFTIRVDNLNDAPSFTKGADITVLEDSGAFVQAGWATAISDGDGDTQMLSFELAGNSNPTLFATAPTVTATGELSFTPAADANGSATLTLVLRDDGGTAFGGVDVSPPQTFEVTVTPVNDAPGFSVPLNAPVSFENGGAQSVPNFASAISAGPADEAAQTVSFALTAGATTGSLSFSSAPAISANGTLTYTASAGTSGTASFDVALSDNGGTANGGVDTSAAQTITITVDNVNDAPSFTKGADVTVLEDSGAFAQGNWATAISDGDGGTQTLTFTVTNNTNPGLFAAAPAVTATGDLSFTPAADANGTATLTLVLADNGGTANSGVDTSASQTFVVSVTAVNDAPDFALSQASDDSVQDGGPQTVAGLLTGITRGPTDEAGQTLSALIDVTPSGGLSFSAGPSLDLATGNLTYTATAGTSGSATLAIRLQDNGGVANGGVDTSVTRNFTINVININDAPSFTSGGNVAVNEDSGAYSAAWASNINDNDGGTQALTFNVTGNTNASLFAVAPSVSPTGVLSFTPATNANGSADITVELQDNGGVALGGDDTSDPVTFTITVNAANDAPSFSIPATAPSVLENAGAQTVNAFATGMSPGPADEAGQTLSFNVSVTGATGNLSFLTAPTIDATTGNLSYEANPNTFGVATISVTLEDDGGVANGGSDTSAAQVFTLEVLFVNNAPSFNGGGNVTVDEDSAAYNQAWATAISDGDDGIVQGLTFTVQSNSNTALFTAGPAIDSSTGNLSFTLAANANGVANLSLVLVDDGGTDNGGADTSTPAVNFSITVNAVNDPPTVTPPTNVPVHRHIGISVAAGDTAGLLQNVSDIDGSGGEPFSVTVQTDAATAQGGRVSTAADGSWSYEPPASETQATDSFSFQVCDSGVPAPAACTTETATLALSGEAIWFVDDSAAPGGDGTLARPFQTLAAAAAAASTNRKIFKFSGSYTAGATLKDGQQLIGQGTTGSFDTLLAITPPSNAATRPSLGGAHPQLSSAAAGITLGSGNTVRGIEIGNTTGVGMVGANVGTLSLGENRIVGSGQALSLSNGTVVELAGAAFTQVSSTSGTNNISLSSINGSLNLGTGALSGASGTAFVISGGTANISYEGTVTANTGQRPLSVASKTGGTVSLRGAVSSAHQGVSLSGNTGATVRFSGGLSLNTGANVAFLASGGGTVEVCDEEPCNPAATGAVVNSLSTTSAAALQVSSTTIGANGLEFRSISSSGASSGIVLDTTGSSGGLSVKGNGGDCTAATPTCSGGRIQNSTGVGVSLSNTRNPSLTRMRIDGGGNHGIGGNTVDGLSLSNVLVQNNGNAVNENGIDMVALTGVATLSNSTITGSATNNISVRNSAGNLSAFNATALNVSGNDTTIGNDGILFDLTGTAVVVASITSSNFASHKGDHLQFAAANSAGGSITFTGNTLSGGHPSPLGQGITLNAATGVPGYSGSIDYVISNNSINGSILTAVTANLGTSSNAALFRGRIENNQIGTSGAALSCSTQAHGISVEARGNGTHTALVSNNTIRQCLDRGILTEAGDGSGTLNLTVVGNVIDQQVDALAREAIQTNFGITSLNLFGVEDAPTVCLDLGGAGVLANTFSNGAGAPDDFRLRKRFGATVRLPGYAGGTGQDGTSLSQVVAFIEGRNNTTAPNSASASGSGGGYTGGAGCPLPP